MRDGIRVDGFEELDRALKALGDDASGPMLAEAAQAGADIIRDEAARLAPRGETGRLADGMTTQLDPKGTTVDADIGPSKDAWYGIFPEFGTSKMPAKPYLRPALEAKRDEALAAVANVLRRLLNAR